MTSPFTIVYMWRQSRLGVSEGLNVLLTDLIRGLSEAGVPVRVLTTTRHASGLQDVLNKNNIPVGSIEIIKLVRGAPFLALKGFLQERRKLIPKREHGGIIATVKRIVRQRAEQFLGWALDLTVFNALLKLPVTFCLLAGFAGIFGGMLLISVLLLAALSLLVGAVGVVVLPLFASVCIALRKPPRQVMQRVMRLTGPRSLARVLKSSWVAILERLYRAESERMGRAIDRASGIPAVFIPSAFEGYLCASVRKKRKIIVFPDVTPLLFPTRFPGSQLSDLLLSSMKQSVSHADGLVCYSEFIRDTQLRKIFKESSAGKPVDIIPQGFFSDDDFSNAKTCSELELGGYVANYFPEYGSMPRVFFGEFSFIIYPTVDRPHKNTLTLLKAFEMLLRERGRNVKLVLTSPGGTTETMDFIRQRKLHRDVLFMPAVPIVVLNQLLEHASVMVHPSLAEGGDIFNFSRAVSHDSAALLSDIPVAREMFERHGLDSAVYGDWLFEATDQCQLADKIDEILCGRWQPLSEQKVALEKLATYRFSNMARKYNDSFQLHVASLASSSTNSKLAEKLPGKLGGGL